MNPSSSRKRYSASGFDGGDPSSSTSEEGSDQSVMSHPSQALRNLFECEGSEENGGHLMTADLLQRPVMAFVLQWNDLDSLRAAMTMALRKAACRTFAMQV